MIPRGSGATGSRPTTGDTAGPAMARERPGWRRGLRDAAEEVPGGRALARDEGGEGRQAAGGEGPALVRRQVALDDDGSARRPRRAARRGCAARLVTRALKSRVPLASTRAGNDVSFGVLEQQARRARPGRGPRRGPRPGRAGRACAAPAGGRRRGPRAPEMGRGAERRGERRDLLERRLRRGDDRRRGAAGEAGQHAGGAAVQPLQRILEDEWRRGRKLREQTEVSHDDGVPRQRGDLPPPAASPSNSTSGGRQRTGRPLAATARAGSGDVTRAAPSSRRRDRARPTPGARPSGSSPGHHDRTRTEDPALRPTAPWAASCAARGRAGPPARRAGPASDAWAPAACGRAPDDGRAGGRRGDARRAPPPRAGAGP